MLFSLVLYAFSSSILEPKGGQRPEYCEAYITERTFTLLHDFMLFSGGQINHVSQCRDIPSKAFWVPETQNMLIAIILISDHEVPQYYGRLSPLSQTMRGVVRVIYANMV